jgi:selenocysteine lyase/cysteine desulfurase
VTFRPKGDTTELVQRAYADGVVVRDLPGTGWVRASCGWWTSDEDVDRLVAAVAR